MQHKQQSFDDANQEQIINLQVKQSNGQSVASKRQIKKLIKKQKWEKQKLVKRKQKREKQKQKKKIKRELQKQKQKIEQKIEQKLDLASEQDKSTLMKKRRDDYCEKMKEGLRVVIDLQFYDLMTQKQQNSLIKQLSHCHSTNRRSQKCFNYIITSATIQRQKILGTKYNADKWGITMLEQSIVDAFPLHKIVYLTGDAEEDLVEFDPTEIYIIGGIVDHNRLKKITYDFSVSHEIRTKRLPMKEIKLKASVHLAVNHVWQWMLYHYNGLGWDQSLKTVIPVRKLQNYSDLQ